MTTAETKRCTVRMARIGDTRQAVLLAALTGDALGAPFNGLKHGHIQQLAGGPVEGFLASPILIPERPEKNTTPGLHSSLGQRLIACVAAMSIPDESGREPVACAGALLQELTGDEEDLGHRMGALRASGRPLRRAITRWRNEYPWEPADFFAREEDSEGANAAIACGIAAGCIDTDGAPSRAMELTRLTHFRSMAVTPAAVVARLIAMLLETQGDKRIDHDAILRTLIDTARGDEEAYTEAHASEWREIGWGRPTVRFSKALEPLPSLLREGNDDLAAHTIVNAAAECTPRFPVTHPQHGFAPAAISWAIYRALSGSLPTVRAVEDTLNRGGETCAVGMLVCALAVARHGDACLPEEWWERTLALPAVRQLLHSPTPQSQQHWLARETEWTGAEEDMREPLRESLRKQKAADAERQNRHGPRKPKPPAQKDTPFAPPPHMWLKPGEEEDPRKKKALKEARARRRIDWKEERRKKMKDEE